MAISIINLIYSLWKYGRYHKSNDPKKRGEGGFELTNHLQEMTLAIIFICAKLVK